MQIVVNSEPREVDDGTTLDELIRQLGLASQPCAAEVNREVVPKADRADRRLGEGDRIELVTLVGGG